MDCVIDKLLNMHAAIQFDDDSHTYTHQGRKISRSVSALVKDVFPFNREQVLNRMVNSSGWKRSKYYSTCGIDAATKLPIVDTMTIKDNIKRTWEDKVTLGKDVHALLERVFTSEANPSEREKVREEIHRLTGGRLDVDALITLFDRYHWTPLQSECRLVNVKHDIAGTADLLLRDENGNLVIVDWKCSKMVFEMYNMEKAAEPMQHYPSTNYWQYTMQLNLYRVILEHVYGAKVSHAVLITFDEKFAMSVNFVPFIKDVELWYLERPSTTTTAMPLEENDG